MSELTAGTRCRFMNGGVDTREPFGNHDGQECEVRRPQDKHYGYLIRFDDAIECFVPRSALVPLPVSQPLASEGIPDVPETTICRFCGHAVELPPEVEQLRADLAAARSLFRDAHRALELVEVWSQSIREPVSVITERMDKILRIARAAFASFPSPATENMLTPLSIPADLAAAREWKQAVLDVLEAKPEFRDGEWSGDKQGWGYVFEFINWLYRDRAAARSLLREAQQDSELVDAAQKGEWSVNPQVGGGWVVEKTVGSSLSDFSEVEIARTRGTLRDALASAVRSESSQPSDSPSRAEHATPDKS